MSARETIAQVENHIRKLQHMEKAHLRIYHYISGGIRDELIYAKTELRLWSERAKGT